MSAMSEPTKAAVDILSVATVLGTLSALLPPLAAFVSIVWGCIRIYETRTMQRLMGKPAPKGDAE